jgi:hypothetical protein
MSDFYANFAAGIIILTQIAAYEELISTDSVGYFFSKIDLCTTDFFILKGTYL